MTPASLALLVALALLLLVAFALALLLLRVGSAAGWARRRGEAPWRRPRGDSAADLSRLLGDRMACESTPFRHGFQAPLLQPWPTGCS